MAVTQGTPAQTAVAALPATVRGSPPSPGNEIKPIVMGFGAGVRKLEVQGY